MCLTVVSLSALVWLQLFDYWAIFGWRSLLAGQVNQPRAVRQLCGHLQAGASPLQTELPWWLVWFALDTRNQLVICMFKGFEAKSLHVMAFFLRYRFVRVWEFE